VFWACRPLCARDWLMGADPWLLAEDGRLGIFEFEDCLRSLNDWPAVLVMGLIVDAVEFVEFAVYVLVSCLPTRLVEL